MDCNALQFVELTLIDNLIQQCFVTHLLLRKNRYLCSVIRGLKNTIAILLTALFVSYYGGTSLFTHTHTYHWGKVTHSHPYVPSSGHTHSAAAIQLIAHLSAPLAIIVTTTFTVLVAREIVVRDLGNIIITERYSPALPSLRAPPIVC